MAATAVINTHPHDYAGLLAIQGSLYSADAAVRDYNRPYCDALKAISEQGVIYDGSTALLIALVQQGLAQPQERPDPQLVQGLESVLPGYRVPADLTNRQLLIYFFGNHINNPNFPTPEWVTATGSYQEGRFAQMSESQLQQLLPQFNSVATIAQLREYVCSLAGTDTALIDRLREFDGHVFLMGTELSFGPALSEEQSLFSGAKSKIGFFPKNWGELDLILNHKRTTVLDQPVITWLHEFDREKKF